MDHMEAEIASLKAQQAKDPAEGSHSEDHPSPGTPKSVRRQAPTGDLDRNSVFTPRKRDAFRRLRNVDTGLDSLISKLGQDSDMSTDHSAVQDSFTERVDRVEDEIDELRAAVNRMDAQHRPLDLKPISKRLKDVERSLEVLHTRAPSEDLKLATKNFGDIREKMEKSALVSRSDQCKADFRTSTA